MSVREEENSNTKSTGSGIGFAAAAVGIGIGVGAALYYFFGQKEPEAGSSTQWEGQRFNMDYTDDCNNSTDYVTTTDTSIYETDPDECSIESASVEYLEYANSDHEDERSMDESQMIDEESSNDAISNESSDSMNNQSIGSEIGDYEEGWIDQIGDSENDSNESISSEAHDESDIDTDFELIGNEDVFDVSSDGSDNLHIAVQQLMSLVGRRVNRRCVVSLNRSQSPAQKREAFRERSWTLEQCSICFEVILQGQEEMSLKCTHRFHTACILPWLQKKQTCPNCRKTI